MKSNLYFFTGAGLSAPSGIPTFRDKGGIWEKFNVDEVCNYSVWEDNRDKVYDFYEELNNKYTSAQPNTAHKFIAGIQKKYGSNRVKIITQNVDDLLERAGWSDVIHLHGKVGLLQCTNCGYKWNSKINRFISCPRCNSLKKVKPNVVMFGENAPNYTIFTKILSNLKKSDIFIISGTKSRKRFLI